MPDTYHLFFADATGQPGTDLTFFPWPRLPQGRPGHGLAVEVSLAVPHGTLGAWARRLAARRVETRPIEERFGERALAFRDPHGLELALVDTPESRASTPWVKSPVPASEQIVGLHGVRLWERELAPTERFLTQVLGFSPIGEESGWKRYGVEGGGSGRHLDLRERPAEPRGAWGRGTVHHVAWRVPDLEAERAVRDRLVEAGRRPTEVIDRFWFRSVYFLEPGGTLFELATDGPGFTVDEDAEHLGEALVLPPWLEPRRDEIEAELPPLHEPTAA